MEPDQNMMSVSHLNIRPSISLLMLQLVFLDVLAASVLVAAYLLLVNFSSGVDIILKSALSLFVMLAVFTVLIITTVYSVLQWINDYYELSHEYLVHKKGVIFRKIERFSMSNIKYCTIDQGILGKILNFGTITFLDPRRVKAIELNLIHSPYKYMEIFEKLDPDLNESESMIRRTWEEKSEFVPKKSENSDKEIQELEDEPETTDPEDEDDQP